VVWTQNQSDGFHWFGLKTSGDGFRRFGLKTDGNGFYWFGLKTCCDSFRQFGLKTTGDGFSGLASKPVVGFLVEPQNQSGGGFPGLSLKTGSSCLVI
jgi:hypothetical protein